MNENKIAVIIPCYNEEQAIEKVIKEKSQLQLVYPI